MWNINSDNVEYNLTVYSWNQLQKYVSQMETIGMQVKYLLSLISKFNNETKTTQIRFSFSTNCLICIKKIKYQEEFAQMVSIIFFVNGTESKS